MDSLLHSRRLRVVCLALSTCASPVLFAPARAFAYEGYGYQSVGGQGGTTYHVTNTNGDTSTGSFRWALSRPSPKIIVFDVGGTIQLAATAKITGASQSFVTIDGTTAPSPGITIRPSDGGQSDSLYIENGAHDVIVKGLRFIGFDADGSGGDLISLYGTPSPVYNIVVDHCTFENGDDGAVDITNTVNDVTVSWNFFHNNHKSQLIKYGPKARLSIHHNVYASNPSEGERNPLPWGDITDLDFVNNVEWGWLYRGLEIRHEGDGGSPGKRVNANVVNNVFTHASWTSKDTAIVYGSVAGPDTEDGGPGGTPLQGTVVTNTNMGQLWVAGNILPPLNRDQYSTVSAPRPVPAAAQVTTWTAVELRSRVLPDVGTVFRTSAEQTLLDTIAAAPPASGSGVTIGDVQVTEGDTGTTSAVFTVSLSPAATQTATVQFATAAGTATAGTDYTTTSGTVTFPAGTTSRTISVPVVGDTIDEPNETFFVNLSGAAGAAILDTQALGTIVDDDTAAGQLSVADVSVTEGNSGFVNAVFTVSLSSASAQAVTVSYATANNTASAGPDYTAESGVLTIPAGATSGQVVVPVLGDVLDEPNETFFVNLSGPAGATIADAQAQGTIVDNDATPALSVADVSVAEGNSGSVSAVFAVSLAGGSAQAITVSYATANNTATAGSDYTAASGVLTIAAGATSGQVVVPVLGDVLDEPNETFFVNLSGPAGATIADAQAQGTILDNDATPALSVADVSVTEGNSGSVNAVFAVSMAGASAQAVTVSYATANDTATAGSDYTAASGVLTIAAGATSGQVVVPVLGDVLDESNETFFVNLSGAAGATIADTQAQGTILDNDATPALSVADVSVTEGNSGSVNAVFAVSMAGASAQAVTVSYATANDTATAGSDYTAASGVLTIAAGATSGQVVVPVLGDVLDESNETFFVNLSGAAGATIADTQAQGTIVDDDSATPQMSVANVSVTEGNTGSVNAVFAVTLTNASTQAVTVSYATANGTATAGSDYTAASGVLTIAAGATSGQVVVPVLGDVLDEPNETFFVNLSGPSGATILDAQAQGTIVDNDATPALSVADVSVTEGNSGSVNAVFAVSMAGASAQAVTVSYATANNTATAGSDYTAVSGVLTIAAGATSAQVVVPVLGDTVDEPNETFFVNLSGAAGATIADTQAQGTIVDDDVTPGQLSVADVSVTEGNSGSANAAFTVSLSSTSTQAVTVAYATANNTATAGSDYTAVSGVLTIAAGATSAQVVVPVLGDTLDEPNETFFVNLSGAAGATIADAQALGTITDNDATPALSVGDVSVTEGNSGSVNAVFTVSLAGASAQAITVSYATADNTAMAGSDYTPRSGVLTFPAASTTPLTVTVPVLGDTIDEPNETFSLTLSAPANATLADSQGLATILDDDAGFLRILELGHGSALRSDLRVQPGMVADRDLYIVWLDPYASYEVLVDESSGDVGTGSGPRVERVAGDLTTVLATSQAEGTGPARSLRLRNSTAFPSSAFVSVRSDSCGTSCDASDTYRIRTYETTASIARFNNAGTQRTVILLQNTTDETVSAAVTFWSAAGVRISTQTFTLTARQSLSMLSWNVAALVDQQGTITVEHSGRYGALVGKAVSLEPSSGYSFDTPLRTKEP